MAAIVLLMAYIFTVSSEPFLSLVLFLLAAGGGVVMIMRELAARPVPVAIAVIHAGIAVAGLVTLLMYVL